jgi:hypothetical protein
MKHMHMHMHMHKYETYVYAHAHPVSNVSMYPCLGFMSIRTIHTCKYGFISLLTYIHTNTHATYDRLCSQCFLVQYIYIYIYIYICMYDIYIYIYMYVCIYAYISIFMFFYIYIYTHIHTTLRKARAGIVDPLCRKGTYHIYVSLYLPDHAYVYVYCVYLRTHTHTSMRVLWMCICAYAYILHRAIYSVPILGAFLLGSTSGVLNFGAR